VNLRAPFVLTRALLPSMRAAKRGRFVFIGSISGTLGSPGAAAYAASKWGLTGFVKSLAEELSDSGLMACAVLPGSIDTDMLKGSPFPARMSAADVAKSVEFLALDAPLAHNGAVMEMFGV
jgi:3-oxoacyl-[acyl-carrier protein] reductase